ncbi:cell division protein FtsA [Thermanaerovibrio velox DSM 12556]|uniref:Cell division protein FtsA n=1 Tax=Thermanaerovibrio velox DSM 12556 TaxID=926567 RepID=H0URR6_9BACT|nr:cell division protein FtsA [Thermanaerovibrio velox]EHM10005.1 cell division protein FtsA [Thermanaerovibrio velox DSM 12556]
MFKRISTSAAHGDPDLLVGLDLGTTKVSVVVAERESRTGEAQIIGIGHAPSSGIRKGLIVNLDQAVRSVQSAICDAENMVGLELKEVTVAFSGSEVKSIRSKGMVSLGRSPRPVMQLDVERVIEAAQTEVSVPQNQSILHAIPVEYFLDGHGGIDDPSGMTGMRLEIDLQSVIVPTAVLQNVLNCVERAGLEVNGLVIKPLASALGMLSKEESMAGAVAVDVGGGTTGVAVFSDGRPKHLAVIPVGGDHITNDVASVLKMPLSKAEEIKKEVSLFEGAESAEDVLEFDVRGRSYSCRVVDVVEVIRCRLEELYSVLIRREISDLSPSMMSAGVVMCGGVAKTSDIEVLVSELLDMPARVSLPLDHDRMPPSRNGVEFVSAAGIIRYMIERERNPFRFMEPHLDSIRRQGHGRGIMEEPRPRVNPRVSSGGGLGDLWEKIRRYVDELF